MTNPTTPAACWDRAEDLYRRAAENPNRRNFYHRAASRWIAEAARLYAAARRAD